MQNPQKVSHPEGFIAHESYATGQRLRSNAQPVSVNEAPDKRVRTCGKNSLLISLQQIGSKPMRQFDLGAM